MISRRALLALPAAMALAHCGPKPPGVVTLTMIGSARYTNTLRALSGSSSGGG